MRRTLTARNQKRRAGRCEPRLTATSPQVSRHTDGVTEVAFPDSLCHRCVHLRVVTSGKGSQFLMCKHPALPKYPRQPVHACAGYEARP